MASYVPGRLTIHRAAAFSAGLCLLLAAATLSAATSANSRAGFPHEIQRKIDEAGRDPVKAASAVTVIIEADPSASMSSFIDLYDGKLRYRWRRAHEISIPAGRLAALAAVLPAHAVMRLPYPHQALAVTGQGVALTGGGDMHAIGNNGAGIKIGIIDTGFANLVSAQSSGDLPIGLSIVDYTDTGTGGSNHGTNVAQIVYDMAPGAQFYLAKIGTDVQLYQAVTDMVAAGVQVINHSVAWYGAAFYDGTGPICDAVSLAASNNTIWVNAMGNDRLRHYMAVLTDSNNDRRHEFAAGQNYNTVTLTAGVTYQYVLNWDAYPTTSVDYNLYLYNGNPDAGGMEVAKSETRQVSSVPYEYISYTPNVSGTYYLVVQKYRTNTTNLRFALFSFGADFGSFTSASSLAQPADCASVISVGATYQDIPEYFSSEGPTTDGRAKPDVVAPDRVQTSLTSSFAGTSAASPHVAGGAVLLRKQNPALSPEQIRWLLTSTSKDVYNPGYDYRTGNGRMSLDADGDGYNHDTDNCPLVSNVIQRDTDGDRTGNACDADDDNDGLSDILESSIGTNPLATDTDGDGRSDYAEVCYDADCTKYTPGKDLNPLSMDTDGDSIPDGSDPSPLVANPAGDIAPLGAPNGVVDVADYSIALRIALGQLPATSLELSRGDLYPPNAPDGVINLSDLALILKKIR